MTLENGVIADLLDADKNTAGLLAAVRENGLKADYFTDNAARTAFAAILAAGSSDAAVLLEHAKRAAGLKYVTEVIPQVSAVNAAAIQRIRELAENGKKALMASSVQREITFGNTVASAADFAAYLHESIDRAAAQAGDAAGGESVSFGDFADPIPEEKNPDALFAGGWLRKGHGLVLVSVSGVGKSVISVQLAYPWARGLPAFGIRPIRPLKIGFLVTEDDDEEMKEFRQHIRRGYAAEGWTELELAAAEANLKVPRKFDAPTGEAFVNFLRNWQKRNKFDLIIVNPLHGVCGYDISNNAELRHFLRELIDPVIKAEETKCALMLIHHTNKPPAPRDRGGFGTDRYAEYVGAGGAELTNWMRAMLAIMPTIEEGVFDLVAAKRGKRLGWPRKDGDKSYNPHKTIVHSGGGLIFWRERDALPVTAPSKKDEAVKNDAMELAELVRERPVKATEAREMAQKLFNSKTRGEKAYKFLKDNLEGLGLKSLLTGNNNSRYYGTEEALENLRKTVFLHP